MGRGEYPNVVRALVQSRVTGESEYAARVQQLLWITVAGGLGTALRYGVSVASARFLSAEMPFGTLLVNVLGSFALGVVAEALANATVLGVEARLILGVGLLGGFTTYSSFNLETLRLAQGGQLDRALLYAVATLVGCLVAGWAGMLMGRSYAA
jgi:CrcB protein